MGEMSLGEVCGGWLFQMIREECDEMFAAGQIVWSGWVDDTRGVTV
jgi:hypothetical protein